MNKPVQCIDLEMNVLYESKKQCSVDVHICEINRGKLAAMEKNKVQGFAVSVILCGVHLGCLDIRWKYIVS